MPENDQHYLEKELYERIQSDSVLFEFLVSSSLDGLWYWDLESPEDKWIHPRIWEILGQDPKGRTHKAAELEALLHPKDAALAKLNLEKHCEDPALPYDQVLRYMHADGSTVWIRCFGIALRDENGKPVRMLGVHNEFTDIKEAEKQLQQTHKEYQALWEDAPVMHVQVDPKTAGIKKCNHNLAKRLGYESMDDIIGRSVLSLYHEDSLPSARIAFQEFSKTGRVENAELILKTKEGDPVPVILNVAAVRDEDGNILHSCSTWVDISELKQAQESLRLSQERFKLFMDHSPMLAWIKDEELRLQYVNSAFEKHRGITAETGLGKKYSELLPGEISERVEATDRRVRDQLEVVEQVEDHLNAEGEKGKWLVFRFPIPGPNGTQWVAGTAMDISDHQRLEAENRLAGFGLDRAAIPFFLVDSEARILRVNEAACKQSGYTKEEFAKMTVHDIDPDFPKEAWPGHWPELKKARFLRFESHHRRKDGSVFPVEIESNYIEFEKEEYTLVFVRDITERKQWAASQERQQSKLEEEVISVRKSYRKSVWLPWIWLRKTA